MFLKKEEVDQVMDQMRGTQQPDAVLEGLQAFFEDRYSCRLYGYLCDRSALGKLRLRFLVYSNEDYERFCKHTAKVSGYHEKRIRAVREEFSRLCVENQVHESYQDPSAYLAVPATVGDDLVKRVQDLAEGRIREYLNTISVICKVSFFFGTVHIFYEKDDDIEWYRTSGLSQDIEDQIMRMKSEVDEFHVCEDAGVVFTSIQTLNEKYGGSMYHYHH
ncbi:MAG: hypothetical protein IJ079_08045 [Lachnospiraceae bacterium]|nr:hypothetical protein [Lachnospiraceae bacterium]